MLHFFIALGLSAFLLGETWAKCQDTKVFSGSIDYGANSVFSLASSKASIYLTVGLPLVNNGAPSCYHQRAPLMIETADLGSTQAEFELSPFDIEPENIPAVATYQYVHVEQSDADNNPKIFVINFLCSGRHPIAADAISDTLQNIVDKKPSQDDQEFYIATGQILGDDYTLNPTMKAKSKIYDVFFELYETRLENQRKLETSSVYIPNVISGLSTAQFTPMEKKLYSSFFSRTGSSLNGCHPDFIEKMQDRQIDNVVKSQPFRKIDIRKKFLSSKYKIRWSF